MQSWMATEHGLSLRLNWIWVQFPKQRQGVMGGLRQEDLRVQRGQAKLYKSS